VQLPFAYLSEQKNRGQLSCWFNRVNLDQRR
jgi:hypothetical protein